MNAGNKKRTGAVLAGVAGAGAMVVAGAGFATASPHAEASKTLVFVGERTLGAKYGPVQFSGAFGDYGKTEYVNAAGHAAQSGDYVKAILKHGTLTIKVAKLQSELTNPRLINTSTCSGEFKATAASPITGGTGAYAHVKGTLRVTLVSDFLLPRVTSGADKGQCNGNGLPLHAVSSYSGTGSATR